MSGNPDVAGLRSSLSTGRGDGFDVIALICSALP